MMTPSRELPVRSLDGSVHAVRREEPLSLQSHQSGPRTNGTASSTSIPRAGQVLTGKQEHCELAVKLVAFISFTDYFPSRSETRAHIAASRL